MEFSLPEAVFKFRQGVGRLIRNKTDTGIIVILDSRIIGKSYGRFFINSIDKCPVILIDENNMEISLT
jgi:ATP-dependent DNA helicase DinG